MKTKTENAKKQTRSEAAANRATRRKSSKPGLMEFRDTRAATESQNRLQSIMTDRPDSVVQRKQDSLLVRRNGNNPNELTVSDFTPLVPLKVIQAQHATGLANLGALTQVNWDAILRNAVFRRYLNENSPGFRNMPYMGIGVTYTLTWYNAVSFVDGKIADVIIHIHESGNPFDQGTLSGGGAWVKGGAPGHGVNINRNRRVKDICISWLEEHYALEIENNRVISL